MTKAGRDHRRAVRAGKTAAKKLLVVLHAAWLRGELRRRDAGEQNYYPGEPTSLFLYKKREVAPTPRPPSEEA